MMTKDVFLKLACIFGVFYLSLLSLYYSGLSVMRAVELQNELGVIFLSGLKEDPVKPILDAFSFVVSEAVVPLLPFLLLAVLGLVLVLRFVPTNPELFAVCALTSALTFLTTFSLPLTLVSLGFFSIIPLRVEEGRPFQTGYQASSEFLRYFSLFLSAALFFGILLSPEFPERARESLADAVISIMPSVQELSNLQGTIARSYITQGIEAAKTAVNSEYLKLSSEAKGACSAFRDSVVSSLDSYAESVSSSSANYSEEMSREIVENLDIFRAISNAAPFLSAVSMFFLLELFRVPLAAFGGAVYSLVGRRRSAEL